MLAGLPADILHWPIFSVPRVPCTTGEHNERPRNHRKAKTLHFVVPAVVPDNTPVYIPDQDTVRGSDQTLGHMMRIHHPGERPETSTLLQIYFLIKFKAWCHEAGAGHQRLGLANVVDVNIIAV